MRRAERGRTLSHDLPQDDFVDKWTESCPYRAQKVPPSGLSALGIGCWFQPPSRAAKGLGPPSSPPPHSPPQPEMLQRLQLGRLGSGVKSAQSFKSLFAVLNLLNFKCPSKRLLHSTGYLNSCNLQAFILSRCIEMLECKNRSVWALSCIVIRNV